MEKTWIHKPGQPITKDSGNTEARPCQLYWSHNSLTPPPPRCSHGNTHTKAFQNSPLDSQDPLSVHLRSSNKTEISPPTELKQRDLFPFPRLIIQLGNFIFFFHSFTTERNLSPELRLLWIIRFLFSGVGIIEG